MPNSEETEAARGDLTRFPATTEIEAQLKDVRELTQALLLAVQAMQAQGARGSGLQGVIEDVRTATRAMLLTSPAARGGEHVGVVGKDDCGCGRCECLSDDCCMFDIFMTHVRAIEMQIEPVDSNALPYAEMEVRMFASIDGIGAVIPGMWDTLGLRKLINKPGIWSQVNQRIGSISVCKGHTKTITIALDAVEVDDGAIEATAFRDEYGTSSVTMVLDCCCSQPIVASVELHFDGGGQGGGAIEAKFAATRSCC